MKEKIRPCFIIFLAVIISSCSFSFAESNNEITFSKIDWLSDKSVVINKMEEYIQYGYTFSNPTTDQGMFLRKDDQLLARPSMAAQYTGVSFGFSLAGGIEGKIGGYSVSKITFTYAYDGSTSKLVCVKVELNGATCEDLKNKLTKVYGESETRTDDEGLQTIVWTGSDNSCVLLYSIDDGETADLIYGRLDAEEILEECTTEIKTADPDDVSGL